MRVPIAAENPDYSIALNLIHSAIECGINCFDVGTFYCHGHCEKAFGQATRNIPRSKLIISGKSSSHQSNSKEWLGQLQNSLYLFHREYVDLYFLHHLNFDTWNRFFIGENVIDQIEEAFRLGLIRHLAFSSHDDPANIKKLIDTGMFETVLLQYNIIERRNEEIMRYAYQRGMGVMIMNAFAGKALINNLSCFKCIEGACSTTTDSTEIALNYVLSQPFIHSVLVGIDSMALLNTCMEILGKKRYSTEELDVLSNSISQEQLALRIPCTECQYCMPCVQGIDIPKVIRIVNQYRLLSLDRTYSREYTLLPIGAECCIECGSCEETCPNALPISEIMKEAVNTFAIIGS